LENIFILLFILFIVCLLGAKAARFYRARPGAKLQALQGAYGSLSFCPPTRPFGAHFFDFLPKSL
jgi:hypothetical protein